MYISKYKLDLNNNIVLEALNDAEKMHKYSWNFFKDMNEFHIFRETIGLLHKIQLINDTYFLLLQSKVKPNNVSDGAEEIYCVDDSVMQKKLKQMNFVNFQVYVNPTQQNKETKKRHGIVNSKDRIQWLQFYMQKNGCELVYAKEIEHYFKECKKENNSFKISVSNIQGRLQIIDFDKFYTMVSNGLGRAKSYGMGMLTFGV